jgi:hypothetical protein
MTPSLPMAANREMARRVSWLPQYGQAMGASALDIGRSASKRRWHCWQIYSYRGIFHLAHHFTVSGPKSQPSMGGILIASGASDSARWQANGNKKNIFFITAAKPPQ